MIVISGASLCSDGSMALAVESMARKTSARLTVLGEDVPRNPRTASATGAAATVASKVPRSFGDAPRPFVGGPKVCRASGGVIRRLVWRTGSMRQWCPGAATGASSPAAILWLELPPSRTVGGPCSAAWVSQPPVFLAVESAGMGRPQPLAAAPKLVTSVGGVAMERGRYQWSTVSSRPDEPELARRDKQRPSVSDIRSLAR